MLQTRSSSISPRRHIGESARDRLFLVTVYVFLGFLVALVLYPLIYIVSSAFSSPEAVVSGQVKLLPVHPSLAGFQAAFRDGNILSGFNNSLFYTVVGTAINVVLTVALAFPLSRRSFYGRGVISFVCVFTLFFNGGLIPYYVLTQDLGLIDSRWSQIIPSAVAVWQVIIARTFFQHTIPDELAEAAEMDGCSDVRFVLQVVVPLSKPVLAVLALMYAVGHWNSYFDALIFINTGDLQPLQMVLRNILILNDVNTSRMVANPQQLIVQQGMINLLQYAVIVIGSLPMLALYPFVQKHFIKGVLIGSLKG